MGKLSRNVKIVDTHGVTWVWDGEYLWVEGAELELEAGESLIDVGFYCDSLEEVFQIVPYIDDAL